jgi:hypothetical protein
MFTLKENYIEWAVKHLQKYSHSDFYPKIFEFSAIFHNWEQVKTYILSLDLDKYCPKPPVINAALKPNGTFRIVHQLDPIDSIIYTALIREICETVERYRIPEKLKIACSYRIKPDLEGSFFASDTGWDVYISRSEKLSKKYKSGYMITADITDFYNQIYIHRIRNLIEEASKDIFKKQAEILEAFLLNLNEETSKGIPVGPAPSIILAELIMASIDKKINTYTKDFVRYVDDIRIFFTDREKAILVLEELTHFLYTCHRLVFSGEKTKIITVEKFCQDSLRNEEKEENAAMMAKADEMVQEKIYQLLDYTAPYDSFDYEEEYEKALAEIIDEKKFQLLSDTYHELFSRSIVSSPIDYVLIRHILRKAARYRVRNLVPLVLDNFERLLPVIREIVIYLNAVINDKIIANHKKQFKKILSVYYMRMPFVNLWVSHLLQNKCFVKANLQINYDEIISTRGKALTALSRLDTTCVRGFHGNIGTLGPWDKRAVLYSTSILPSDEMKHWIRSAAASGDIIDKSISSYLIAQNKPLKK